MTTHPTPHPSRRTPRRRRVAAGALSSVLLAATVGLGGCSSDDQDSKRPRPGTTSQPGKVVVTTTTITAGSAPAANLFPDFTGVAVGQALTLLSAAGFGQVQSVDATGQGRLVPATDEWTVSAQSIPSGRPIEPSTPVTLFAVEKGSKAKSPDSLGYAQVPEVLFEPVGESLDALVAVGLTQVLIDDFSGEGRAVPADDTWVVTSQVPTGGSWVLSTQQVRLAALPDAEIPKPKDGG